MSTFPDNYGESYKSIAFDGTHSDNFTNSALHYNGKTYAIWGDTWGDVVVGSIDSKTNEVQTGVIINNKRLSVEEYAATLSISKCGKLTAYVANACCKGGIMIFSAQSAESVSDWAQSGVKLDLDIKQLCAITDQEQTTLLILTKGGELYQTTKSDGEWAKESKIDAPAANSIKVAANEAGSVVLLLDDKLYSYYDGKIAANNIVADGILDAMVDEDGSVNVAYSAAGKYYIKSSKSSKGELLPLKGEVVEVVLDGEDANSIYYTAVQDSITEINQLSRSGRRWRSSAITVDTPYNNRGIVAVGGSPVGEPIQLCWIQETTEDAKANPLTAIKVNILQPKVTDTNDKAQIELLMAKVADWQLTYSFPKATATKADWHWGAFYEGLIVAYELTGDSRYLEEMMNVGEYYDWKLRPDFLHADRLIVCDIYAYLYNKMGRKDPRMMVATDIAMDLHTSRKADVDPRFDGVSTRFEWWTWCDALYMAAPAFYTYSALSEDPAAKNFAFKQWQAIADYLYSEEESLFYRDDRFFEQKSSNGFPVFWSRGNGWVAGALTRILGMLESDDPQYAYYEKMYREICAKLLELQRPEGLWTVSLMDPEELLRGESSGSGFFGFAFAWGVNNGVLDREVYGAAAKRAWAALSHNVTQFGRLGYVQQVAGSPYPFYEDQAHTYASGSFLLFANEMLKME